MEPALLCVSKVVATEQMIEPLASISEIAAAEQEVESPVSVLETVTTEQKVELLVPVLGVRAVDEERTFYSNLRNRFLCVIFPFRRILDSLRLITRL